MNTKIGPPPVHWPHASARTAQPAMSPRFTPVVGSGVVQEGKGDKRRGKAESNWRKFVNYNTQAARDIERGILAKVSSASKVYSKIINLMLEWNFDALTIGHASGKKSNKKNANTDPACETIRSRFATYLS